MAEPITEGPELVVFESRTNEAAPGTPAVPRTPHRLRDNVSQPNTSSDGILVTFESEAEILPSNTPPASRPADVPRTLETADAQFARGLADRVLEYVRARPTGMTAEQLAALVQQYLARRSA